MGLELIEVSATRAVGRYPVAGNSQPAGLWHGGASGVAAETMASLAASAEVGPAGGARGVELSLTHLRPARSGWITATATALKIGKTLATYAVSLTNDAGEEIASGRVTLALQRK
jgi:uncharacterized protein (TIGR00369 family)